MPRSRPVPLLTHPDKPRARRFGGAHPARAPIPSELKWHIQLTHHTLEKHRLVRPDWEWTHFPAGGERTGRGAGIMALMGTKPGWPDLLFASPCTPENPALLHGLELKKLGEEASDDQRRIRAWFLKNRWPHAVVDNIKDALDQLWGWGALRMRVQL